jgi:aspartyl/asparaginyl beta-hydroxylase (cupin superfamily)
MAQISWLAADYLLIRLVVWAWMTPAVPIWGAVLLSLLVLAVSFLGAFGLLVLHGVLIAPFCERKSLHLDFARHFPEHVDLEAVWESLRDEWRTAMARRPDSIQMSTVLPDNGLAYRQGDESRKEGGWNTLFLRLGGRNIKDNSRHFPTLARLIDLPHVTTALFSTLNPGVELLPHRGYARGLIRYHLTLEAGDPGAAWMDIGGQTYEWKEGEGILFDDMYVHAAHNVGTTPRTVLFLDIRRRLPEPLDLLSRLVALIPRVHPYALAVARKSAVWGQGERPRELTT